MFSYPPLIQCTKSHILNFCGSFVNFVCFFSSNSSIEFISLFCFTLSLLVSGKSCIEFHLKSMKFIWRSGHWIEFLHLFRNSQCKTKLNTHVYLKWFSVWVSYPLSRLHHLLLFLLLLLLCMIFGVGAVLYFLFFIRCSIILMLVINQTWVHTHLIKG